MITEHPAYQSAVSATLVTTPVWSGWLFTYVEPAAQLISTICGAIIGLYTVYRIARRILKGNAQ